MVKYNSKEIKQNTLHSRYERLSTCLKGKKFSFMKGRIIDVVIEMYVKDKQNMSNRKNDILVITDAGEYWHLEIIHKHPLTKEKINDYFAINANSFKIEIPEKNIFDDIPDEEIKKRLLQPSNYKVVTKAVPFCVSFDDGSIVEFNDFEEKKLFFHFIDSNNKRYTLLKCRYNHLSPGAKKMINNVRANSKVIELPEYDLGKTIKENLLEAKASFVQFY